MQNAHLLFITTKMFAEALEEDVHQRAAQQEHHANSMALHPSRLLHRSGPCVQDHDDGEASNIRLGSAAPKARVAVVTPRARLLALLYGDGLQQALVVTSCFRANMSYLLPCHLVL